MIDNLIQLILIVGLCRELIHLPDEYIFGKILPGAAFSILFGNLFYAWQARQIGARNPVGKTSRRCLMGSIPSACSPLFSLS